MGYKAKSQQFKLFFERCKLGLTASLFVRFSLFFFFFLTNGRVSDLVPGPLTTDPPPGFVALSKRTWFVALIKILLTT